MLLYGSAAAEARRSAAESRVEALSRDNIRTAPVLGYVRVIS